MVEVSKELEDLDREILGFVRRGVDQEDPELFNRLALKAFSLQYAQIPLYRRYCDRRGISPDRISSWEKILPLSTDVFKAADLTLVPQNTVRTFQTSGTSGGREQGRVRYDQAGLRLMDETIYSAASAYFFPDGIKALVLVLAPPPDKAPHMVMAYGMSKLMEYFGLPGSRFLAGPEGLQINTLIAELRRAESEGISVAILGGSFGFVNFFAYCLERGVRFELPPGSRCLDAGGFKGKSREITCGEFLSQMKEVLGIPEERRVNLLGMTELASQFYDTGLRNNWLGRGTGPREQARDRSAKANPPWTRTMVVHPETSEPLPHGEIGLLRHFDLANRGHICAIQTDDLGRMVPGGFEILGRAAGGKARGCSLSIDEITRITERA